MGSLPLAAARRLAPINSPGGDAHTEGRQPDRLAAGEQPRAELLTETFRELCGLLEGSPSAPPGHPSIAALLSGYFAAMEFFFFRGNASRPDLSLHSACPWAGGFLPILARELSTEDPFNADNCSGHISPDKSPHVWNTIARCYRNAAAHAQARGRGLGTWACPPASAERQCLQAQPCPLFGVWISVAGMGGSHLEHGRLHSLPTCHSGASCYPKAFSSPAGDPQEFARASAAEESPAALEDLAVRFCLQLFGPAAMTLAGYGPQVLRIVSSPQDSMTGKASALLFGTLSPGATLEARSRGACLHFPAPGSSSVQPGEFFRGPPGAVPTLGGPAARVAAGGGPAAAAVGGGAPAPGEQTAAAPAPLVPGGEGSSAPGRSSRGQEQRQAAAGGAAAPGAATTSGPADPAAAASDTPADPSALASDPAVTRPYAKGLATKLRS